MKVPKIKYKFVIPVPFLELKLQFIEIRQDAKKITSFYITKRHNLYTFYKESNELIKPYYIKLRKYHLC